MVGQRAGFANVNFDYNGPPVLVTNGMALDLVSQFGIQNAWYAFLKLRGLSLSKNETEKTLALKRFRNKIRQLRRSADLLRDRNDEHNTFLGKDFNVAFIKSSIALTATTSTTPLVESFNATEKNQPPTSSTINEGKTENNSSHVAGSEDHSEKDDMLNDDELGKLVIDEEVATPTTINIALSSPTTNLTTDVLDKLKSTSSAATTKENSKELPSVVTFFSVTPVTTSTVTTAAESSKTSVTPSSSVANSSDSTNATAESVIAKRHHETIDDVVSSVMEKIRNNLPLEGELSILASANSSVQTNSVQSSSSQRGQQQNSKNRGKSKNSYIKQNAPHEDNKITSSPLQSHQQMPGQSHLIPSGATTLVDSTGNIVATIPAGHEHLALSALGSNSAIACSSSALHQSLVPDQVTILSNFTEIIRASTSSQQTNASQLTPVTKIITQSGRNEVPQQHFHQHKVTQIPVGSNIQFPSFTVPLSQANAGRIPVGISPNGTITLPNNITIQSLLQSLQQQSKKQQLVQLTQLQLGQHHLQQNQQIQFHIQPPASANATTLHHPSQQQQILPDSSSQDVGGIGIQISQVGPTVFSQNPNSDLKFPKKRQYVRRKGVTAAKAEDTSLTQAVNSSNSTPTTVFISSSVAGGSSTTENNATTGEVSSGKSSDTSLKPSAIASKKVLPTKLLITPTKETKEDCNLDALNLESDNDEKSKLKKVYVKKNKKASTKSLMNTETQKNNKDSVLKTETTKANAETSETTAKLTKQQLKSETIIALREKDLQKISELEKELSKCQKQLNAEKNKFNVQKKKLEKLQVDLEKGNDAIQLVQIDLACQKTDNNNLTAQNIALNAELQKLKSKKSNDVIVTPPSTSTKTVGRKPKDTATTTTTTSKSCKTARAGGKRGNPMPTSVVAPLKKERLVIEEPIEYGRRQSKRISVTRKGFLYNLF